MLLGIKNKKELSARHTLIGFLAVFFVFLFWPLRSEPSFDVRVWRALGDAAFSFLFITLAIGPLAKLWKPAIRLVFLLKNRFGRIDADFIRQVIKNLNEPIYYIAGLPAMVADMRNLLSRLGIDDAKIYFEDFIGY